MSLSRNTIFAITLSALALSACASGPSRGRGGGGGGGAKIDVSSQAETILSDARKKKAESSCAAAIPSYRVVSSFGKGYEVAQSELGACLLEVATVSNPANASLLREEALLWLRRSAYAGNASAQLALADALSGASPIANSITPDLVEGYGWALIYKDNAAHKLYGLPELHPAVANHFNAQLDDTTRSAAQSFAANYKRVEMDVFVPPFTARTEQPRNRNPQGRQRRRR